MLKNYFLFFFKLVRKVEARFDKDFLANDIHHSKAITHHKWQDFLFEKFNQPGLRILEVGSREVTSHSKARSRFNKAEYIGFDYYEGNNVDVVGDAHKLSSYFEKGEKFDLIFSSACFEHFVMPWRVSEEMNKLCRIGGHIFVETHFSFSSHERPWHFFHYSDMALRAIFPEAMGIKCIEAGVSNPIIGRFSSLAAPYLQLKPVTAMYCHVEFFGQKVEEKINFNWETVEIEELVGETKYPEPNEYTR